MNNTINRNELFPIYVRMSEINSLIVGGGNVALEKLTAILSNAPRAKIHLIAPQIKPEILNLLARHTSCQYSLRSFQPEDLVDIDLIFLTTDDPELHKTIKSLSKANHILVNTADTPDLCDFYLSSIVQKGNLKIAISTNGMSPTLAKRIKEMLTSSIPDDINQSLDQLHQIRSGLKGDFEYKIKTLNKLTGIMAAPSNKLIYAKSLLNKIVLLFLMLVIGFTLGFLYKKIVP